MRVKVRCHCGWRRELSGFYAGKRIRCADCEAILDVPGEGGDGAYVYPPLRSWETGARVRPQGQWVPVGRLARSSGRQASVDVRYFPALWRVLLMLLAGAAIVVLMFVLLPSEAPASPGPEDGFGQSDGGSDMDGPADRGDAPGPSGTDDDFESEYVDEF